MSRGAEETKELEKKVEGQLDRLLDQLQDIHDSKDDMDEEEYAEQMRDTVEQLQDFRDYLESCQQGKMSVVDSLGRAQLAIQAAVSNAFMTPEVIKMFAKRQPELLRERLELVEAKHRSGKMDRFAYFTEKTEILSVLKKLGEELRPGEADFFDEQASEALKAFAKVSEGSYQKMALLVGHR